VAGRPGGTSWLSVIVAMLATLIILTLSALPGLAAVSPAPAADGVNGSASVDPSVLGDQSNGRFLVQAKARSDGRPAEADGVPGGRVDSCPGCKWAVYPACGAYNPDDPNNGMCTSADVVCPPGQVRMRTLFMPPGTTTWTVPPSFCYDPNAVPAGAAPPLDITGAVRNYLESLPLPAPSPSFQPPGGTLVNLPTIFDAGSGPASPAGFDLAGLHITVTPKPLRWTWTFEPGVTQTATLPGGTYPNKDVTYTYRTTGPRAVTVAAVWGATYRVNGGADQPVDGTVTRTSAPITVPVYEARSELVAGTG
jgi:hypothetical protein